MAPGQGSAGATLLAALRWDLVNLCSASVCSCQRWDVGAEGSWRVVVTLCQPPGHFTLQLIHRIIETFRLEKTSKFIESNRKPNTAKMPTPNCVPKRHIYTFQGWWLHHFPGQPVPVLYNPFREDIFPNIKSTPPLVQVEAVSSQPITCYLGKRDQQPPATRFTGSLQSSGTCRGTLRRGRLVAPATVASRRAVCGEQG